MSAIRLTIIVPVEDIAALPPLAKLADQAGVDAMWIETKGAGDAMVTLAAIAASTRDLRLGLVTGPLPGAHAVPMAEELGMLDNASRGRMELVLRATSAKDFAAQAAAIRHAWRGVELNDGRVVGATPFPYQPELPITALIGKAREPMSEQPNRRIVIAADNWLALAKDDPASVLPAMHEALTAGGASECVIPVDPSAADIQDDVTFLTTVVGPTFRAGPYEVQPILADALGWYQRYRDAETGLTSSGTESFARASPS